MKRHALTAAVMLTSTALAGAAVLVPAMAPRDPAYPFHDVVYGAEWSPQPGGGVLLP